MIFAITSLASTSWGCGNVSNEDDFHPQYCSSLWFTYIIKEINIFEHILWLIWIFLTIWKFRKNFENFRTLWWYILPSTINTDLDFYLNIRWKYGVNGHRSNIFGLIGFARDHHSSTPIIANFLLVGWKLSYKKRIEHSFN